MVAYFNTHLDAFWFAAGFTMLAVELLVLGFSSGFILFLGVSALVTGGLLWFDLLPDSWLASIASFAIGSVIVALMLWKPLKRLELGNRNPAKDNTSDFIGLQFRLDDAISLTMPGKTRYSGIDWKVEIDRAAGITEIAAGTLVAVASLDVGKFRVVPVAKLA